MTLRPVQRLARISQILEAAAEDSVSQTPQNLSQQELTEIYSLARGEPMILNPKKGSKVKYIARRKS